MFSATKINILSMIGLLKIKKSFHTNDEIIERHFDEDSNIDLNHPFILLMKFYKLIYGMLKIFDGKLREPKNAMIGLGSLALFCV